MPEPKSRRRCWLTFPTSAEVQKPIIWQMSRRFPDVSFDIRQASVNNDIGIMAVEFEGGAQELAGALAFLRESGLNVEPIEKSVVEG